MHSCRNKNTARGARHEDCWQQTLSTSPRTATCNLLSHETLLISGVFLQYKLRGKSTTPAKHVKRELCGEFPHKPLLFSNGRGRKCRQPSGFPAHVFLLLLAGSSVSNRRDHGPFVAIDIRIDGSGNYSSDALARAAFTCSVMTFHCLSAICCLVASHEPPMALTTGSDNHSFMLSRFTPPVGQNLTPNGA